MICLTFAVLAACTGVNALYPFAPDTVANVSDDTVASYPLLYNLTALQLAEGAYCSSWWISSYLTTSDNHQYFAISHALNNPAATVVRATLTDLTDLAFYSQFEKEVDSLSYLSDDGRLDVKAPGYGFRAVSADSLSTQNTYFEGEDFSFNITWDITGYPLLNFGGNPFLFGTGNSTEVSYPGSKTKGTLTINGTVLTIDSAPSDTWYDRQICNGVASSWTWFELNFGDGIKASIWSLQGILESEKKSQFATVRDGKGTQAILSFDLTTDHTQDWTSPATSITYNRGWTLTFSNGDYFNVKMLRHDQEISNASVTALPPGVEGFVVAEGSFFGRSCGYGLVEQATPP